MPHNQTPVTGEHSSPVGLLDLDRGPSCARDAADCPDHFLRVAIDQVTHIGDLANPYDRHYIAYGIDLHTGERVMFDFIAGFDEGDWDPAPPLAWWVERCDILRIGLPDPWHVAALIDRVQAQAQAANAMGQPDMAQDFVRAGSVLADRLDR